MLNWDAQGGITVLSIRGLGYIHSVKIEREAVARTNPGRLLHMAWTNFSTLWKWKVVLKGRPHNYDITKTYVSNIPPWQFAHAETRVYTGPEQMQTVGLSFIRRMYDCVGSIANNPKERLIKVCLFNAPQESIWQHH